MSIIRPRLNDFHNIPFTQEEVDFAIPFVDEDIPLYVDPFLLWKSPSMQDNSLHLLINNSFNNLGDLTNRGKKKRQLNYQLGLQNVMKLVQVTQKQNKAKKQETSQLKKY